MCHKDARPELWDAMLAHRNRALSANNRLYHLLGLMLLVSNTPTGSAFGEASERSRENDLRAEKCRTTKSKQLLLICQTRERANIRS